MHSVSFHKEYTFLDRDNTRQVFIFHKMAYTLLDGDNATTVSEFQFNVDTLSSERMALTYFLRGGCAVYLVLKKSIRYVPETANVPEDGATLHVQKGPNCAIYRIFNLNPFFRDWTFRSSKR